MLNISENESKLPNLDKYQTVKNLINRPHYKIFNRIIFGVSILVLIALFLPWTQNISGTGSVTTLKPGQRPQSIQSVISGRLEKWYVKEGDFVNNSPSKGDDNITDILPTFTSEAEKIDHDTKGTLDGEAAGLLNSADVFKNERVHLCK